MDKIEEWKIKVSTVQKQRVLDLLQSKAPMTFYPGLKAPDERES